MNGWLSYSSFNPSKHLRSHSIEIHPKILPATGPTFPIPIVIVAWSTEWPRIEASVAWPRPTSSPRVTKPNSSDAFDDDAWDNAGGLGQSRVCGVVLGQLLLKQL